MESERKLSEQESLQLITSMIQRAKNSYYESGTSSLLWGSAVSLAAFVTFLQQEFSFNIGFDIWLLVLIAIIPQIFISVKESKQKPFKSYNDNTINAVWMVYGVTILGLTVYQNVIPFVTENVMKSEGFQLVKHYTVKGIADEPVTPYVPSITSVYLLIYALPTLITGIIKKFTPMIIGAIVGYALFFASLFTSFKFDMLFATITAICCWLIPGCILRIRYIRQKTANV